MARFDSERSSGDYTFAGEAAPRMLKLRFAQIRMRQVRVAGQVEMWAEPTREIWR